MNNKKKKITLYVGSLHGSFDKGIFSEKALDKYLELDLKYKLVAVIFIDEKNYLSTRIPCWLK